MAFQECNRFCKLNPVLEIIYFALAFQNRVKKILVKMIPALIYVKYRNTYTKYFTLMAIFSGTVPSHHVRIFLFQHDGTEYCGLPYM
jgi:hypothetical protein